MNRTTVSLEAGLFRRLKEEAARKGKTLQGVLNEFLRLGLEAARARKPRPAGWRLPTYALGRFKTDPADRHGLFDALKRL